jgi:chromosomal replication initiation ATPase DnaA
MTIAPRQQNFDLAASDWLAPKYFIVHSGVQSALEQLQRPADIGFLLDGPRGSGKSHFLGYIANIYPDRFVTFDWMICATIEGQGADEEIRRFIAAFEDRKKGGPEIILVEPLSSPHVKSRLSHLTNISITLPRDEELLPLVSSILERRNIRLEKRKLERLVARLPANPLSLAEILTKIDAEVSSKGSSILPNLHRYI